MDEPPEQTIYRITVKGHLDESWAEWFGNLVISHDDEDNTVLAGPIVDQAALQGILTKIWYLNLALLSVTRIERDTQEGQQ